MSKYDELSALLTVHGQLLGHPKYTALMAQVSKELEAEVAGLIKPVAAARPAVAEVEWSESNPEPAPTDSELSLRRL